MLEGLLAEIQPYLLEIVTAAIAAFFYRAFKGNVSKDTLHSAVRTGVQNVAHMLEDGRITREELIEMALQYARNSSPGAIKRLGPSESTLRSIASAKLNEMIIEARKAAATKDGQDQARFVRRPGD